MRRGAVSVEFALTFPILFLLLLGALELGRMNMIRETVNNAAYDAARTCIVPGATNKEGVDAATAILNSIGVSNGTVQVQPSTITDTTPTVSATVSVPYSTNMWFPPIYASSGSATVTCTLTRDWVLSTRNSQ
jgi:Flp pilus assembly protein TadG